MTRVFFFEDETLYIHDFWDNSVPFNASMLQRFYASANTLTIL